MRLAAIAVAAAVFAASGGQSPQPPSHSLPGDAPKLLTRLAAPPETIFIHGKIYTGEGLETDSPVTVEAMAVGGGKVIAVGTPAQIEELAGPGTVVRDLTGSGTFVFPGFNDAHTHLGLAGQTRLNLDLTGVRSLHAMLQATQSYAAKAPAGHWITGGNWDHTLWPEGRLPTRKDLDKVTGGHPAFLGRVDGHIGVANSAALKAAGITGRTAAPPGGAIDLDAQGEPTGIVRESAQMLIRKAMPPASAEDRRRGAELAIADALAHGVTSVQDFSDWQDFLVYEQMENEGRLRLRITEWLPFKAALPEAIEMRDHHDRNDPMLHTGFLKGFMDGSLGSRTAAMKAPYSDDPGNMGLPQYTQDELNGMAVERARAGFQLGFHAIGDKANAMALDAYERVCEDETSRAHGGAALVRQPACSPAVAAASRNRIEHAQVVDAADIPRFAKLGVIASMQPSHLLTDTDWAEARIGPRRARYSYAWKAFLDAGVRLAFGTDYPVEPVSPFRGLYAAVTRKNEAGTREYYPENRIARGQALYAYTQGSAYAEFAEARKGKLAPGFDADFILVDRDLYTVAAAELLKTKVRETWVAGRRATEGN